MLSCAIMKVMNIKKILASVLFLFVFVLVSPKVSRAFSLQESITSENSIITKVTEGIEYFFAFKVENKVRVLEKHAEKRLVMAQNYAEEGNNERVQELVQSYLQIKERENNLLGQVDSQVLGAVAENTIEQQIIMEEIKTNTIDEVKTEVMQVQEQVVNQVAERIVEVNGPEGQTEFFQEVEHVWAPGTGPGGGESGVVIEGGQMQFAPGTSAGGPSGADIQTTVIQTGGGENNVQEGSGSGGGLAPGTEAGGNDGGNNPGTETHVIDP